MRKLAGEEPGPLDDVMYSVARRYVTLSEPVGMVEEPVGSGWRGAIL